MGISDLRHPPSAGKVAGVHGLRSLGLYCRIDAEDRGGDVAPVGAFSIGIKQAQIVPRMTLIIGRDLHRFRRATFESACAHGARPVYQSLRNTSLRYPQVLHLFLTPSKRQ